MYCNQQCPLGIVLLAIPFWRLTDSTLQQSMPAQLPWWLWLVFVLLALVAISWWELYLRPRQAKDVQDLERRLDHGHENHAHSGSHAQPAHAAVNNSEDNNTPGRALDPHDTSSIPETNPGNPLDSDH